MMSDPTPPTGSYAPPSLEELRDHLAGELARVTPVPVGGGVAQLPQGVREPEYVIVTKSELARLRAEVARLTAELNEADRRAGAAERQLSQVLEGVNARRRWLEDAKAEAGYDRNVSFVVVWAETLEKARRTDAAEARAARAEGLVRELVTAIDALDATNLLAPEWDAIKARYNAAVLDARRALTEGDDR